MSEEEKIIDIKGTIEQFVKPDEPEMTQEEAIMKYQENTKISADSGEGDTTEEQEHLKRVKQELLASLERVKKLEKQIFYDKEIEEKKKIKVEKSSTSGKASQVAKQEVVKQEEKIEQKERE